MADNLAGLQVVANVVKDAMEDFRSMLHTMLVRVNKYRNADHCEIRRSPPVQYNPTTTNAPL